MSTSIIDYAASRCVWNEKYRLQRHGRFVETTVADTLQRVARALSVNEINPSSRYTEFLQSMEDLRFIPGGRILANAGAALPATLFSCFVMGRIGNSIPGILDAIPATVTFEQFAPLYRLAYDSGLKGCTVFRPNPARGHVLSGHPNHDCDFSPMSTCS